MDGDELLRLALSRPAEARARADRLLAGRPGPRAASFAHQARAIVLRDAGRLAEAVRELRRALRLADTAGDKERGADIRATLGVALVMSGRTAAGLAALDQAVRDSTGRLTGRVLMRRGDQLATLGRRAEALADLNRAIAVLRRHHDRLWEARARTSRFGVYANLGQAPRARRDLDLAERLYSDAGQELEAAMTIHNRAEIAVQSGDLPAALSFLDEAAARYDRLGFVSADLVFDRCKVLLAAGLSTEALAEADAGAGRLPARSADRAELLFAAARAAQAAGRTADAVVRARAARDLFRAQRRVWWATRAGYVLAQAEYDDGRRDGRLRHTAGRIADRLDELGAEEAPAAHLLAGRLATGAEADRHLARAARLRYSGPAYGHAAGWLAHALRADVRGATASALRACRRGLIAVGEHQRRLGAVELRVHAAAYGSELVAIAQRQAVRRADARMLLVWSERFRAGTPAPAAGLRPPDDPELTAELTALRDVMTRRDAARAAGEPADRLERDRRRLESAIRARTRRATGGGRPPGTGAAPDTAEILSGLGDHLLVELIAVDDTLHAVTARPGRTRLHAVGPVAAAIREVDLAGFMLRRLARGRPPPDAAQRLAVAGRRLERALLGPAAADIGDRPVVIVPPGRLHAVPWAMLPRLGGVPWSVAPSAAVWWQAGRRPAPRRRRDVIVVGPGLPGTLAEAAGIAAGYRNPIVLTTGAATARRVLAALDGASTAHVAAHGVFRGDSPLFSAVHLDDGPLTVYEFGRLRRAPHRMILSSCESGVGAPVAGDELLGMISVLVPLGTTSLLASMVPVNDAATVPLMADFHAALRRGAVFAEALLGARTRASGDPVAAATAAAFVVLGR